MTKHTPEPWTANPNLKGDGSFAGTLAIWTNSLQPKYIGEIPLDANARRIVACVNACAGIPTEALEELAGHPNALREILAGVTDIALAKLRGEG